MAKTRAQRKAERRAREAEQQRQQQGGAPADPEEKLHEGHSHSLPPSGEVEEFEAVLETGQPLPEDAEADRSAVPGVTGDTPEVVPPSAPAPSRADAPPPAAPPKKTRREQRAERKAEAERERKQKESEARLRKDQPAPERQRGRVIGFLASCWAELQKVQWPDRDTLVQASAVTLVFVAVMAAYLGALDAMFDYLIKRIL